ncbi:MAG: hypothetical protein EHM59_05615 [Betaproteobacteria bacterium]|nr:MAG: hypothetical protein EHM59_05615 [Betaproteobacteria bacterium]
MTKFRWLIIGCTVTSGIYAFAPVHRVGNALPGPRGIEASHTERTTALRAQPPYFTALVHRVGPTVVSVTTHTKALELPDVAERHFEIYLGLKGSWKPFRKPVVGTGSGYSLDQDGHVPTGADVVEAANEIYVRLAEAPLEQCQTRPVVMIASCQIPAQTPGAACSRALSSSQ